MHNIVRHVAATALVIVGLFSAPASAIVRQEPAERRQSAQERGRALLDTAVGVDGAMGADLALTLLETDRLPNRALRREACDVARARLDEADEPVPVETVTGRHIRCWECREWTVYSGTLTFPVDALSLRCRLATQVLGLDAKEALDVMLELPPGLELRNAACGEMLIARPAVFFKTLRNVLLAATSAEERREGKHWEIASRYIAGCASVSSIGPVCEMIASLDAPPAVLDRFATELAAAIDAIDATPREVFHVGERKQGVEALAALLAQLDTSSSGRLRLVDSMRSLVLRSLAEPRCQDLSKELLPEVVGFFNETIFPERPILKDDAKQPPVGDSATVTGGWASPVSWNLLTSVQELNTARREMKPAADLTEWKLEYAKLAARIRSWSSVDEADDFDYISLKTSLIGTMIQLAPDDASRREAARDFVTTIRHAKRSSIPAYILLTHAMTTLAQLPTAEQQTLLEYFRTGPGALSTYAAFQLEGIDVFRLAPTKP